MHGKEHVENILSFLAKWLNWVNFKVKEGSEEAAQASLFVLLGAIYLHDIGMQCSHGVFQIKYLGEDLSKHKNGLNEWYNLEKVRRYHQLLSYLILMDSQNPIQSNREYPFSLFNLEALNLQKEMEAIALLSASHADIDIMGTQNFPVDIKKELKEKIKSIEKGLIEYAEYEVKTGVNINLKKLMVILRIGDASDASYNRIDVERFNKEKIWNKLFFFRNPLALNFLFHILKHFFVELVDIDEHYNISFKYRFPQRLEVDKKIQDNLVKIAEYPLRRNLNLYRRKAYLPIPILLEGSKKFEFLKSDLLNDIKKKLKPNEWNKLLKLIERHAKEMASIDLRDSIRIAENKIWILGQNLRFPADPSRATNRARKKDEFYKLFSQKLDEEEKFEIKLLIYNPKEKWDQIKNWHNGLINTWLAQSKDERGEHRNYPPNFVKDLKFSFKCFKKWQKDFSCFGNRFLVKCYTPEKGFSSKNLIDPDDTFGLIEITQGSDRTNPDPISRSSEQMVLSTSFPSFKSAVNQYKEFFAKAQNIEKIKIIDWDKLSSYVIEIDLVKKICGSLGKTDKIQRYLKENISILQSTINRISMDDQYYTKFNDKKEKLEEMLKN